MSLQAGARRSVAATQIPANTAAKPEDEVETDRLADNDRREDRGAERIDRDGGRDPRRGWATGEALVPQYQWPALSSGQTVFE
jgi:hypothetical protein